MSQSAEWIKLQTNKTKLTGLQLPYWSRRQAQEKSKGSFRIDAVKEHAIEISGDTIQSPRTITEADFDFVAGKWPAYRSGQLRRDEVNRSQNTTYLLTLLHWLDSH